VNRFRAKNTKATQAQSKLKQIERMDKVEAPSSEAPQIDFQFPQPRRSGQRVITLRDIDHAYGQLTVYQGMNFAVERGQRVVLVGPNGAGKSTLLKLLAGVLEVQSGERILGHNAKAGYFSQYRVDMLHPERTVLEEGLDTPQRVSEQFVRTLLGCFLFRGDDVFKQVSVLSGGEKSRLALVKLLLDPPNLLLMDEPTTHLDLTSVEALVYALDQFQGTLIFISHDVYFIRSLANHVVHVNAGKLTHYPGGYDYYLEKTKAESARAALTGGMTGKVAPEETGAGPTRKDQRRVEAEERHARYKRRKAQQEVVDRLEAEIQELEARQGELVAELELPETYEKPGRPVELNRELVDIQQRLAELNPEWEQQASVLGEIEKTES
jgi:ATP-binding cassette, subfamily F, member 3